MADWKATQGEIHRFENNGDSLEGELLQVRDGNYYRPNGEKSKVYDIKTANGSTKTVFGSMVLERQMGSVKPGTMIKIVYKGTVTTKTGREAKAFDVFTK